MGDNKILELEFIQDTSENVKIIGGRIRIARDRYKSHTDAGMRHLDFKFRNQVLIWVSLMK